MIFEISLFEGAERENGMRLQTACFTGHREIPAAERSGILREVTDTVRSLYERGYRTFCAGGALGFDTIAAQAVLALRKTYPDIRLHLILPCKNQAARWSAGDQTVYETIKAAADEVTYTAEEYTRYCMHVRNRRLVDESSVCICYLKKPTGGTAYTVNYAEQKGLQIVEIK